MKIKDATLRRIIREEAGRLREGCPVDLPCPYAAAEELKAHGASPEELLSWIAILVQELTTPAGEESLGNSDDSDEVLSTFDDVTGHMLPNLDSLGIALESRLRKENISHNLSSRQFRRLVESVVGPGDLVKAPRPKPIVPKKTTKFSNGRRVLDKKYQRTRK
jgi:hypothetical protein